MKNIQTIATNLATSTILSGLVIQALNNGAEEFDPADVDRATQEFETLVGEVVRESGKNVVGVDESKMARYVLSRAAERALELMGTRPTAEDVLKPNSIEEEMKNVRITRKEDAIIAEYRGIIASGPADMPDSELEFFRKFIVESYRVTNEALVDAKEILRLGIMLRASRVNPTGNNQAERLNIIARTMEIEKKINSKIAEFQSNGIGFNRAQLTEFLIGSAFNEVFDMLKDTTPVEHPTTTTDEIIRNHIRENYSE